MARYIKHNILVQTKAFQKKNNQYAKHNVQRISFFQMNQDTVTQHSLLMKPHCTVKNVQPTVS